MDGSTIVVAFLVVGMGVVAGLVVDGTLSRFEGRGSRSHGATLGWSLLVLAPLLWQFIDDSSRWVSLPDARDYGGAAPLLLSPALYVTVWRAPVASRTAVETGSRSSLPPRLSIAVPAAVVLWLVWMTAIDGSVGSSSLGAVSRSLLLVTACVGVSVACELVVTRSLSFRVVLAALIAGMSCATACGPYVSSVSALVAGSIVGAVASVLLLRRRGRPAEPRAVLRDVVLPASIFGLLVLGLADSTSGFIYTGQPTQLLTQLILVTIASGLTVAVGLAMRAATRVWAALG